MLCYNWWSCWLISHTILHTTTVHDYFYSIFVSKVGELKMNISRTSNYRCVWSAFILFFQKCGCNILKKFIRKPARKQQHLTGLVDTYYWCFRIYRPYELTLHRPCHTTPNCRQTVPDSMSHKDSHRLSARPYPNLNLKTSTSN